MVDNVNTEPQNNTHQPAPTSLTFTAPLTVISGGQTGADLGGLLAASAADIPTTGWAPKGFKTEKGPKLILRDRFGLIEHAASNYTARTEQNVKESGFTVILATQPNSAGTKQTVAFCHKHEIAYVLYSQLDDNDARDLIVHLQLMQPSVINVAGNRETVSRGLTSRARDFLTPILKQYQHEYITYGKGKPKLETMSPAPTEH
jgi:hypothetical protein